jgi:hypothetical protein
MQKKNRSQTLCAALVRICLVLISFFIETLKQAGGRAAARGPEQGEDSGLQRGAQQHKEVLRLLGNCFVPCSPQLEARSESSRILLLYKKVLAFVLV